MENRSFPITLWIAREEALFTRVTIILKSLEVALLSEVCKDVAVEPHLQPVTGEEFDLR